jgi:hypothetical protein
VDGRQESGQLTECVCVWVKEAKLCKSVRDNNLEILIEKRSRRRSEWMKERTSKWHSHGIQM